MKQFELKLTYRDEKSNLISYDIIEDDNLVSLLAQFIFVVAQLKRKMETVRNEDDNIPF